MKKTTYYPFLDGFRAIALIMVLLHHARRGFDLDNLLNNNPPILSWIYFKFLDVFNVDLTILYYGLQEVILKVKGVLGVQIFFIISGFLITRGLLNSKISLNSIRQFYLRRFFRVYPAYFLMVLISFVFLKLNTDISYQNLLFDISKYAFFLQNYFQKNFLLEHTWTMVVFEHFYLTIPLIIYLVFKICTTDKLRWKVLLIVFIMLKFAGPFIRNYYLSHGLQIINWPFKSPTPYFTTMYHMGSFGMGGLLALLEVYGKKFKKSKVVGLVFWVVGIAIYWVLYFNLDWNYNFGSWYLYSLGSIACACIFIAAYQGVSVLSHLKFLQWIGKHSYGIYLWHILVFMFWIRFAHIIPLTLLMVLYFVSAVAAGYLSSITIERYFLKLFKKEDCLKN